MAEKLNSQNLTNLFEEQMDSWEQARSNYDALKQVRTKDLMVDNFLFKVQFNPCRIVSSSAKVDAKSIKERKCFLCEQNRPAVQRGLDFFNVSESGDSHYTVLVNPFPIFPKHLTIPLVNHQDQLISGRFDAMLNLAEQLPDYTLFYNGPKCGASAPDHFHFQAGNRGFLTFEKEIENVKKDLVFKGDSISIFEVVSGINGVIFMEAASKGEALNAFDKIYSVLDIKEGEKEPMLNILCWYSDGTWRVALYIRSKHRPACYFAEGEANILLSPASVDLGGVLITPLEKDFEKISVSDVREILSQVLISFEELHLLVDKIKTIL